MNVSFCLHGNYGDTQRSTQKVKSPEFKYEVKVQKYLHQSALKVPKVLIM